MRPDPRRLTGLVLGVALATATIAAPSLAQDESPAPDGSLAPAVCDVLTADEVSAAFGEPLTLSSGDGITCEFDSDIAGGRSLFVFTNLDDGDIESLRSLLCESDPGASPAPSEAPCKDLTVASHPAMLSDAFGLILHVQPDPAHTFWVQLVGDPIEGVDAETAMVAIAELAVPRLGNLPAPTAQPSEAALETDTELEALFPTDIAGSSMTVQSAHGESALVNTDEDLKQLVLDALSAHGKTVEDLSIAFGTTDDGAVQVIAMRVRGADIQPFTQDLIGAFIDGPVPSMTPEGVAAGKDVSSFTQDGQQIFVYPKGEILWMVAADGAALIETFARLP
jgi:hypothetical protein